MHTTSVAAKSNPPHILVVDDEEIVLVALRQTLHQLGYAVSTASDAVKGLDLLRHHRFAVVITDHQMPLLTGLEFLAQVRQLQPDATRILITAVLNLSTVIDAINKAEIYRFLMKPWQREDLLTTLQTAVSRHQALLHDRELLHSTLQDNLALTSQVQVLEELLRHEREKALEPQA